MRCEKCGKKYKSDLEGCPFCEKAEKEERFFIDEEKEKVSSEAVFFEEEESDKAKPLEGKPSKTVKRRNYDYVTKSRAEGQNIVLKTLIVGFVMLILTVGIGTAAYIYYSINQDSAARTSELIAKGATVGVSKGNADKDLGSKYYISGINDTLPLRSAPSQNDYEELESLSVGTVVLLQEKTGASFWQVKDFATDVIGYVAPTFLSKDESKIITLSNEALSETLGFSAKEDKITSLSYVLNAGEGVPLYSTKSLKKGSEIATLIDGNTIGIINASDEKIWRVYDYRSSQYGFMESKYLTADFEEVLAARESATTEETTQKDEEKTQGEKYYVSWSDSRLAVRDAPSKETGTQLDSISYGDVVEVLEKTNDDFWYVYVPDLELKGYVRATCLSPGEGESGSSTQEEE